MAPGELGEVGEFSQLHNFPMENLKQLTVAPLCVICQGRREPSEWPWPSFPKIEPAFHCVEWHSEQNDEILVCQARACGPPGKRPDL